MTGYPDPVARAANTSYAFNFGDYISRGFNIVGKNPGLFIGYTLVYFIILIMCQLVPLVGLVGSFVASPCLTVGFYLAADKQESGKQLEFADFFKGFDYVGQLILVSLIQSLIMVAAMIPFFVVLFLGVGGFSIMSGGGDGDALPILMVILVILFMIPVVYLSIAWVFAPFLVVFHKMEAWPALEASRKIITKNWLMFLLLSIVAGFIGMLGFLVLGFGALYSVPAVMCMYYAAFADIVGVNATNRETSFMDHLVD